MKTAIQDQWVILWSHSQQAIHIEQVSGMLKSGIRAFMDERSMDYSPLWIGTREECDQWADEVRRIRSTRVDAGEQARAVIDSARGR